MDNQRINKLLQSIETLSANQQEWIELIVKKFQQSANFYRNAESDLITECVLQYFGDNLKIHHSFSNEPFTKDKFEFALERAINQCHGSKVAVLATRGNPGHDITIGDKRFSLKTQADRNILVNIIHISKFHELGKGKWGDDPNDLVGLREQFFFHMQSYDRILTFRRLSPKDKKFWRYELIEIPKALLEEARNGVFEMKMNSTQYPKPGYCYVIDSERRIKFSLYFDGGTERKLQIKQLDKNLCFVHATWEFSKD